VHTKPHGSRSQTPRLGLSHARRLQEGLVALQVTSSQLTTICHAIVLPIRKGVFGAGFRPDSDCDRPAGVPILRLSRLESGQNSARKADVRPGSTIAQHRVAHQPHLKNRLERRLRRPTWGSQARASSCPLLFPNLSLSISSVPFKLGNENCNL
jgi:hypothetical protein